MYLGDVAPFIPVARRLKADGHDVTFIAPAGFASVLESEDFAHHEYALDASPSTMDADARHTELMRRPFRNMGRLSGYWMDRGFADDSDAALESLLTGCNGADVVVTHPTMGVLTVPVARSIGAKVVVGQLFPMMIPTSRWTPPLGPWSPNLGRLFNRAAWAGVRTVAARSMRDEEINRIRTMLGQPPLRGNAAVAWLEADRTVVLASRHFYGDAAADWPPVRWGGFSIWTGPGDASVPPDLDAHIDAGEAPVLVTLGTSAATDAGERFARIATDLDRHGLRSVVLVGHDRNLSALGDHPGAVTFAPVTRLLPRCCVAVVSGALGGIAAALAAGVPTVVHPQLFDQLWNGRRIEELGLGLMARKVDDVGDAVQRITADPAFEQRAKAMAERMAGEDGALAVAEEVAALVA